MVATLALRRSQVLCASDDSHVCLDDALQSLRAHLEGLLVVTDMRSNKFGDGFPLHDWQMSGKVHAVQGLFANGSFQDTCAGTKLACAPPCYRLRSRAKPYYLADHSFDFWAEDFLSRTVSTPPSAREAVVYSNIALCDRTQTPGWQIAVKTVQSSVADATGMTSSPDSSLTSTNSASSEMPCDPLDQDPGSMSSERPYEAEPECMVCLSRVSAWVFESCGHLGVCGDCRKWMCKEQFNKHKSEQCRVTPSKLTMNKAGGVMLKCPYCRRITRTVHHNGYQGTTYAV